MYAYPALDGRGRWSHGTAVGLVLLLASAASSGLASVKNEFILKREVEGPPMPFMAKNAVLYLWGFGLNLASWKCWGSHPLLGSFNSAALVSIACLVGLGLACAVILRYLDNVVRCFSSVAQVLMTMVLSHMLPARLHEGTFGVFYAMALVLLSVALVIYQAHGSQQLRGYVVGAAACAVCVSLTCNALDRFTASR